MPTITVDALTFTFPNNWEASQLDDWSFYRNQFQNLGNNVRMACSKCSAELQCASCNTVKIAGIKAVDILGVLPGSVFWLIEVKDYRLQRRTKVIDLADEIALKVRDSLAVMLAASLNANNGQEKSWARTAVQCPSIRVVLHLEQPAKHSRLFPRVADPAKVRQRLKQLIKAIDPHPLVVEMSNVHGVPWKVKQREPS